MLRLLVLLFLSIAIHSMVLTPLDKEENPKQPQTQYNDKSTETKDDMKSKKDTTVSEEDISEVLRKPLPATSHAAVSIMNKLREADQTDKLKSLARKVVLGLNDSKSTTKDKFRKLKSDMQRKLAGTFTLIYPPRYKMYSMMYAAHVPQVQDPKISVQTFNPPPISLQKGMMPDPHYYYRMKIPEKPEPDVTKEIHLGVPRSMQDRLKDDIKKAFVGALSEYKHTPFGEGNHSAYKLNVFNSKADRLLDGSLIRHKIGMIYDKIKRLKAGYELFRNGVEKKLDGLNSVINRYNQTKLNYIIN